MPTGTSGSVGGASNPSQRGNVNSIEKCIRGLKFSRFLSFGVKELQESNRVGFSQTYLVRRRRFWQLQAIECKAPDRRTSKNKIDFIRPYDSKTIDSCLVSKIEKGRLEMLPESNSTAATITRSVSTVKVCIVTTRKLVNIWQWHNTKVAVHVVGLALH